MGLNKRGDSYLRTLLMHGARTVMIQGTRSAWIDGLLKRRPFNVIVAAVANKLGSTYPNAELSGFTARCCVDRIL